MAQPKPTAAESAVKRKAGRERQRAKHREVSAQKRELGLSRWEVEQRNQLEKEQAEARRRPPKINPCQMLSLIDQALAELTDNPDNATELLEQAKIPLYLLLHQSPAQRI